MLQSSKFLDKAYILYFDCIECKEYVPAEPSVWFDNISKYSDIAKNYFKQVNNKNIINLESDRIMLLNNCRSIYYNFMLNNL